MFGGGGPPPPPNTANVLLDVVGYICSESLKCDNCLPRTLGVELRLSLVVTHDDVYDSE